MMGDNKILATGGKILAAEEPWRKWPKALLKTLGRNAILPFSASDTKPRGEPMVLPSWCRSGSPWRFASQPDFPQ